RDDLADLPGGHGPGVGGGLDGAHVAPDHDGDKPAADLLPPDEADVGGLDHGVGGLDGADESPGLDEAEGSGRNASVPVPVSGHGGCFLPLLAGDRGPTAGCRFLHLGHVVNSLRHFLKVTSPPTITLSTRATT